jgi:hypothetical protein
MSVIEIVRKYKLNSRAVTASRSRHFASDFNCYSERKRRTSSLLRHAGTGFLTITFVGLVRGCRRFRAQQPSKRDHVASPGGRGLNQGLIDSHHRRR